MKRTGKENWYRHKETGADTLAAKITQCGPPTSIADGTVVCISECRFHIGIIVGGVDDHDFVPAALLGAVR